MAILEAFFTRKDPIVNAEGAPILPKAAHTSQGISFGVQRNRGDCKLSLGTAFPVVYM